MDVALTGVTGFVGSSVAPALKHRGHRNIGLVRNGGEREAPSGCDEAIEWNAMKGNGIRLEGVNVVVHLAGRAHIVNSNVADSTECFREVNVTGTTELARRAASQGVQRFVFVSSIGVNGNETMRPFTESDLPAPQEPYAVSKHEAEEELRAVAWETGIELVIIRPPLVYGPRAPGNFGSLLRWVSKGVPLPLGAVTANRRSLIALDNLVDFIVTCVEHPAAANETFLIADGEDVSTAGLLREVGSALGRPARLVPVPVAALKAGAALLNRREMARRLLGSLQVDASKAREHLGWTPPISFEEGMRRAVAPMR